MPKMTGENNFGRSLKIHYWISKLAKSPKNILQFGLILRDIEYCILYRRHRRITQFISNYRNDCWEKTKVENFRYSSLEKIVFEIDFHRLGSKSMILNIDRHPYMCNTRKTMNFKYRTVQSNRKINILIIKTSKILY